MYNQPFELITNQGLGIAYSSYEQIGRFFKKNETIQTEPNVFYNVINGNVFIKDRPIRVIEGGEAFEIGYRYNSNVSTPTQAWGLALKKLSNISAQTITLSEDDGHETTYTLKDNMYYAPASEKGTPYLQRVGSLWVLYHPDSCVKEYFDESGNLCKKINAAGQVTIYKYSNNQLISILGPSGDKYEIKRNKNVHEIYFTKSGLSPRLLQTYTFNNNGQLTKNEINGGGEIEYAYSGIKLTNIKPSYGVNLSLGYLDNSKVSGLKSIHTADKDRTDFEYQHNQFIAKSYMAKATISWNNDSLRELKVTESHNVNKPKEFDLTQYNFNELNQLQSIIKSNTGSIKLEYEPSLKLPKSTVGANDQITNYYYDYSYPYMPSLIAKGQRLNNQSPERVTRYIYDYHYKGNNISGRFLRFEISPCGRVKEYRPDADGYVASVREYITDRFDVSHLPPDKAIAYATMVYWAANANAQAVTLTEYDCDKRGQTQRIRRYAHVDKHGFGIADEHMSDEYTEWNEQGCLESHKEKQQPEEKAFQPTTKYQYDSLRRPKETINLLSKSQLKTSTSHDDKNHSLDITFPNLRKEIHQQNSMNLNITEKISAPGLTDQETNYKREIAGRIQNIEQADKNNTFTYYDSQYRFQISISPTGITKEICYNVANRFEETIHYANSADMTKQKFFGPDKNQWLKSSDDDRHTYKFFDKSDREQYLIDAEGYVTEIGYDDLDNIAYKLCYKEPISPALLNSLKQGAELDLTQTMTYRSWQYFRDADGYLIGEVDPAGYVIEYKLDGAGRTTEKIQYANTKRGFSRHADFKKIRPDSNIEDAHTYSFYDARDQLIQQVDAEGYITNFDYLPNGKTAKVTRFYYGVDKDWFINPTLILNPKTSSEDQFSINSYDELNRLINTFNSSGQIHEKRYDEMNNIIFDRIQDALDLTSTNPDKCRATLKKYDGFDRVTHEINAYVAKEIFEIEANKNLTKEEKETLINIIWKNKSTKHFYNEMNQITETIDSLGNSTYFYYDLENRPVFSVDVTGAVTQFTYNNFNEVDETRLYIKRLDKITVDTLKGGTLTKDIQQILTQFKNDDKDIITKVTRRDKRGLVKEKLDPEKNIFSYKHDAFSNITEENLPVSEQTPSLKITHLFNDRNQEETTIKETKDLKEQTDYRYTNINGKQTDIINALNARTHKHYDRLGRLNEVTDPENGEYSADLDSFGRPNTETINGDTTTHSYNQAERSHTTTSPENVVNIVTNNVFSEQIQVINQAIGKPQTWEHEPDGQIKSYANELGNKSQSLHDSEGRLQTSIQPNNAITAYQRNATGQLKEITEDEKNLNLTTLLVPNVLGQNDQVTNPEKIISKNEFDCNANLKSSTIDIGNTVKPGLNITTSNIITPNGQISSTIIGDEKFTNQESLSHQFDSFGRNTGNIIDPNGLNLQTIKKLDIIGRTVAEVDAEKRTSYTLYDKKNCKRFHINPMGAVTEWKYNTDDKVTCEITYHKRIDPSKITEQTRLDELKVESDPQNDSRRYNFYDGDKRERFNIDILYNPETNKYEGIVQEHQYNGASREIKTIHYYLRLDADQIENFTTASLNTLVPSIKSNKDRITRCVYDDAGRERFLIDGEGVVTEQRFNSMGKVITTIVYAKHVADPEAILNLKENEIIIPTDPENDRTTHSVYDNLNRLEFTVDAEGGAIYFKRDSRNNVLLERHFSKAVKMNLSYEEMVKELRLRILTENPEDRIIAREFDALNRETKVTDQLKIDDDYLYSYENNENIVQHIDRAKKSWIKKSDRAKRTTSEISPSRMVTTIKSSNGKLKPEVKECAVENKKSYSNVGAIKSITLAANTDSPRIFESGYNDANLINKTTVEKVDIDNPNAPASFNENPVTPVDITTQMIYDTKNNKIAEQLENGFWKFYIHDTLGNLRYELDPISPINTLISQCIYKIKYSDNNSFGETELEKLFANSLQLDPSKWDTYIASGITFSEVHQLIKTQAINDPSADRTSHRTHDLQGNIQSIKGDEIIYSHIDEKKQAHVDKASPLTLLKYNSFGEETRREKLINQDNNQKVYAVKSTWYNRNGKPAGECDENNAVIIQSYNIFSEEEEKTEYANPLAQIPASTMPLSELKQLADSNSSEQDRKHKKNYDLRGDIFEEILLDVPIYKLKQDADGLPQLVKIGQRDLKRTYTYSDTQLKTSMTLEDGISKECYFHDACGNKIAKTDVTRLSNDEKMQPVELTPLTALGYDVFNKPVISTRYKMGTTKVIDDKSVPVPVPISLSEEDQTQLTLRDKKRGLPILIQDPAGNLSAYSYTKDKHEARKWHLLSNWVQDANNSYAIAQHIDEERSTYDANQRATHTEMRRDNQIVDHTAIDTKYNNFDEKIEEDLGRGYKIINRLDQAGNKWFTNEEKGVSTIMLPDLNRNETARVQSSASDPDLGLESVKYSDLESVLEEKFPVKSLEFQLSARDKLGRIHIKTSPPCKIGLDTQRIPLQMQIKPKALRGNDKAELKWNLQHVNTVGATSITIFPVGKKDQARTLDINTEYKTDSDKSFCRVDLSTLPTDLYEYRINYGLRNSNGDVTPATDANAVYISQGLFQVDNGPSTQSQNVIFDAQDNKIILQGKTNLLSLIELIDADGTVTSLTVEQGSGNNPRFVDISNLTSGRYRVRPIPYSEELKEGIPLNLYTNIPDNNPQQPLSREITCSAQIDMTGVNGKIIVNAPSFLQNKALFVVFNYINANNDPKTFEGTLVADENGQYPLPSFENSIKQITQLTLSIKLSNAEILPIYQSEAPLSTQNNSVSNNILANLREDHFHDGLESKNDRAINAVMDETIQTNFQEHTLLYITPITGLDTTQNTLTFTDVSLDIKAQDSKILITGKTEKGITVDVTGLSPGNYPYQHPITNEKLLFSINKKQEVYSGFNGHLAAPIKEISRQFDMDRWNNVTKMTDSLGNATDSEFSKQNKLQKRMLPAVPVMLANDSIKTIRPTTLKNHNSLNHQTEEMDPNGYIASNNINAAGQKLDQYLGDGTRARKSGFDALDNEIATADARDYITRNKHNHYNLISQQITPDGNDARRYEYNEKKDIKLETNGLAHPTRYNHDSCGNISERFQANGDKTELSFGRQKELLHQRDKDGLLSWDSDEFGNYNSHTNLGGAVYSYKYDHKRQKTSQSSTATGHTNTLHAISLEKLIKTPNHGKFTWGSTNSLQSELPRGQNQELRYENGRLVEIKDFTLGIILLIGYDSEDHIISVLTKTLDNHDLRKQTTSFDAAGRESQVFDTLVTMDMTYDASSNKRIVKTNLFNPKLGISQESVVTNKFDGANRIIEISPRNGHVQRIEYQLNNNKVNLRISEIVNGVRKHLEYNENNLLFKTSDAFNRPLTMRVHDKANRLTDYYDYVKDRHTLIVYEHLSDNIIEQIEYVISTKKEISRSTSSNFTATGSPHKQETKYQLDDGKGNGSDDLTRTFANYDSKMEMNVSGTRTINGDPGDISTANEFYDANGISQARIGSDKGDAEEKDYAQKTSINLNSPLGHTLDIQVFASQTANKVNHFHLLQTAAGQPLTVYDSVVHEEDKHPSEPTPMQSHATTEWGGVACTMQQGRTMAMSSGSLRTAFESVLDPSQQSFNQFRPQGPISGTSATYPPTMPREYIAVANDTYDSIAEKFSASGLGDAIAFANGYKQLQQGTRVLIPPLVVAYNKSGDYKPYDDFKSKILGALYPHMDTPQPKQDDQFLETIVRAVSVAVSVAFAVGTGGSGSPLAVALMAAINDVELQGVAKVLGLQKKIYVNDVIEAGVGAAMIMGGPANLILRAAEGSVVSQLSEMAVGTRSSFDVQQVIGAVATQYIGGKINVTSTAASPAMNRVGQTLVGDIVGAGVNAVVHRQNLQVEQFAIQAIGSQIAAVAGETVARMKERDVRVERDEVPSGGSKAQASGAKTIKSSAKENSASYKPNDKFIADIQNGINQGHEKFANVEIGLPIDVSDLETLDLSSSKGIANVRSYLGERALQQDAINAATTRLTRYNQQVKTTSGWEKWKQSFVEASERRQIMAEGEYATYSGINISNIANYTPQQMALFNEGKARGVGNQIAADEVLALADFGFGGIAEKAIAKYGTQITASSLKKLPTLFKLRKNIVASEKTVDNINNIAHNRIQYEALKAELRQKMQKPVVNDPNLQSFINKLYKPNAKIGSGSTADAVREEVRTGQPVGGRFHTQKSQDALPKLQKWLQNNTTASPGDRAAVENIIYDLQDALGITSRPKFNKY